VQESSSTAGDADVTGAEESARYDVIFSGDRLGFDLGENPEVGGLPIVSSVDAALLARSTSFAIDGTDAAAGGTNKILQLPEVGDSVLAVNGQALDFNVYGDLFDAALDLISAAGRPLNLTFARGISTTNNASSMTAVNVADPEGGDESRGLLPLVEEDEASTATWMSAGDGSIVGSGNLVESSQTDLVEISDSRVSHGNAGLDSASVGGSITVGGSMTLGGADPSLSMVHAGDEPASICDNFDSDHGDVIGSPIGDSTSAPVLPEANDVSSGTVSLEKVEAIENTSGAVKSSLELTVAGTAPLLDGPTTSVALNDSEARNIEERADHIFESVDADTEEAVGEEVSNSSEQLLQQQQKQQQEQPEQAEQEPKREKLFCGTSEVLRLAKEKAAARLERRGLDLAALDLSTLEAMLDDLKTGWGARFAPAFAAVGLEDVDDLADITPDEMVRAASQEAYSLFSSIIHINVPFDTSTVALP